MKNICISFFLLLTFQVGAQTSYDTSIAFILRDANDEIINLERFAKEYQLADVMGNMIPESKLKDHLWYDQKTGYLVLRINTIGPRFSFAIYHNNEYMAIYLPFRYEDVFYAVDFTFKKGTYLFDFKTKNKEKLYSYSNIPHYKINKINWRKQRRRFLRSSYANDPTYLTTKE